MKIALFHENLIAKTDISCFAIALTTNDEYDKHTFVHYFRRVKPLLLHGPTYSKIGYRIIRLCFFVFSF